MTGGKIHKGDITRGGSPGGGEGRKRPEGKCRGGTHQGEMAFRE